MVRVRGSPYSFKVEVPMPQVPVRAVLLSLAVAFPALAADEAPQAVPLAQPLPAAEETPGFQAVRPLTEGEAAPAPAPVPVPAPVAAAPAVNVPAPVVVPAPVAPPPAPPPPPAVEKGSSVPSLLVQGGIAAMMAALGGMVAGLAGVASARASRRAEDTARRKAAAAGLAVELEARMQAFEAVPVPPNAEAGVSFVSAVTALADLDYAWSAAQGALHLLPERLTAPLAVHYAAVNHVARFIKGQSFAAGLRMLQANRIGGAPSPDAATMREAHVELAAAFRGLDKLVLGLKGLA